MSKLFRRFVCLILVIASLTGILGADMEPFDLEDPATEETAETSEMTEYGQEAEEEDYPDETDLYDTSSDKTTLSYVGDSYEVKVSYGPETGIPSDCELQVTEIPQGDVYDE